MDLHDIALAVGNSGLGEWMRTNVLAMPIVEALHVIAAATVFGTVLVVDLRLLGLPDLKRAVTRVSGEMLHFTWAAFGLAVITGVMMFAANANTYYGNTEFRIKLLALAAAGVNMAIFHFGAFRSVAQWDSNQVSPRAAKVAAALSILLWVGVIFVARWIGFTKGYDFSVPDNIDLDLTIP
jgi:hypothetical protein